MSSENVCDFCLNPIDSNYQIKELRRKLDVAKRALDHIGNGKIDCLECPKISLLEHQEDLAKQALAEIEGEK